MYFVISYGVWDIKDSTKINTEKKDNILFIIIKNRYPINYSLLYICFKNNTILSCMYIKSLQLPIFIST